MSSAAVEVARSYYDSDDADQFYSAVWGGEDIHIGIYRSRLEPIAVASRRTVQEMAQRIPDLERGQRVVDLGSGYCGAARYLAREHGLRVDAVNLSEVENRRARELNQAAGLRDRIQVVDGSFETLPFEDGLFDLAWSQDAILHSERREQVLHEAHRVLRAGGHMVLTDPMQSDDCPPGVLQPILDRIHLGSLGSPRFYQAAAEKVGLVLDDYTDLTPQLVNHYRRVPGETEARRPHPPVGAAHLERMRPGLRHPIEGGEAGHLAWGIFLFRKP